MRLLEWDITEWDDSVFTVAADFRGDDVIIQYCDGVTHCVTPSYFRGSLRARPRRGDFFHVPGCKCTRGEN